MELPDSPKILDPDPDKYGSATLLAYISLCAGSQALQRAGAGADPERGRDRHDPAGERLPRCLARPRRLRVQERGGQGAHRTACVPGAGVLHQGTISKVQNHRILHRVPYTRVEIADFWLTFHHDGKISPGW